MVETSDEWIRSRTGIRERRMAVSPKESTLTLAVQAMADGTRAAGYQLASARSTWRRAARQIYVGAMGPADAPTVRGRLRASIDAGRAAWRERKPGGKQ